MIRQMERSAIVWMAKRGKSIRQIAQETGHSPTTIARVLREPVDREAAPRRRRSQVDPYRAQIAGWIAEGLSAVRMLELVRADPAQPYTGSRSQFGEMVRRLREDVAHQHAVEDVPIRFEGLPGSICRWIGARSAPSRSRSRPRRRATSWPAGSSTAAGVGCAGPRTCARRRSSGGWWIAC